LSDDQLERLDYLLELKSSGFYEPFQIDPYDISELMAEKGIIPKITIDYTKEHEDTLKKFC
jgi:hypothetical protein